MCEVCGPREVTVGDSHCGQTQRQRRRSVGRSEEAERWQSPRTSSLKDLPAVARRRPTPARSARRRPAGVVRWTGLAAPSAQRGPGMGGRGDLAVEEDGRPPRDLGRHRLRQHAPPGRTGRDGHVTSLMFFPESVTSSDQKQTSDKPNLRDIRRNPRPRLFRGSRS